MNSKLIPSEFISSRTLIIQSNLAIGACSIVDFTMYNLHHSISVHFCFLLSFSVRCFVYFRYQDRMCVLVLLLCLTPKIEIGYDAYKMYLFRFGSALFLFRFSVQFSLVWFLVSTYFMLSALNAHTHIYIYTFAIFRLNVSHT